MYQRNMYENGSLKAAHNLGHDPTTIWSFIDVGKCMSDVVS